MVALFQMAGAGPEHIKELQVGAVQHSKTVCRDFPGFSTNVLWSFSETYGCSVRDWWQGGKVVQAAASNVSNTGKCLHGAGLHLQGQSTLHEWLQVRPRPIAIYARWAWYARGNEELSFDRFLQLGWCFRRDWNVQNVSECVVSSFVVVCFRVVLLKSISHLTPTQTVSHHPGKGLFTPTLADHHTQRFGVCMRLAHSHQESVSLLSMGLGIIGASAREESDDIRFHSRRKKVLVWKALQNYVGREANCVLLETLYR